VYGKKIELGNGNAEEFLKKDFVCEQEMFFDYCLEVKDFEFVFTSEILELLRRYKFFKEYKITSYSTHYDDLPAVWLDALQIMDYNYDLATRCKDGKEKT